MHRSIIYKSFRKFICVSLFLFVGFFSYGEDWVLGAEKFSFTQNASVGSAQNEMASLLPKLILEQISTSSRRLPSATELYDRKKETLLTERISLFLQLSAAVKKRDSLFLSESNSKKLKSEIEDEEDKILEIEKKISLNLQESELIKGTWEEALEIEKLLSDQYPVPSLLSKKKSNQFLNSLNEKITFYGDNQKLFECDIKNPTEREYEKKVIDAKIRGLISGKITVYKGYMMVNCELRVFPGNRVIGGVVEVGSMDDLISISNKIAQSLLPLIANAKPVDVYFDINPLEVKNNVKLNIDGIVYHSVPEKVSLSAGFHSMNFSCDGYNDVSVTYDFEDKEAFLVHVPMQEKENGIVSVSLKQSILGTMYLNGQLVGNIQDGILDNVVTIDGRPYIGQIFSEEHRIEKKLKKTVDEEGNEIEEYVDEDKGPYSAFFYIPSSVQKNENALVLNTIPNDISEEIEKRRVWMYRGYSAFVVSFPIALICQGKFNTALSSYYAGHCDANEVYRWNTARVIAGGITIAAGSFFAVELVRYLITAGKVVPKETKVNGQILPQVVMDESSDEEINVEKVKENDDENHQ